MCSAMRHSRVVQRLRRRKRRALIDITVMLGASVGVVLLDGPVDSLAGFACFLVWTGVGTDFWMMATDDNWMVFRPKPADGGGRQLE